MAITYALEGGSSLMDQLGQGHVIAGKMTASAGTDAVVTSNDKSLTAAQNAAGDYTITFGEPFNAAPFVTCTPVNATFATTKQKTCELVSVATNSFRVSLVDRNGTLTALTDQDFHFIVVGKRYN